MPNNEISLRPIQGRKDLFYPDLDINISKIMPTMLRLFNYKFQKTQTFSQEIDNKENWKELSENKIKNILFVTIDALGYYQFKKFSTLLKEKFEKYGLVISSVYPTITSTCITTLKYGEMPINHGIVGHKINVPEIDNIVDTLTLRSKNSLISLPYAGVNVKHWVWTDLPHKDDQNLHYHSLIENHITNSGLSYLVYEKQDSIGYSSNVDCFAAAQRILETNDGKNRLIDLYIGSIDHIQHRYTNDSPVLKQELKTIEQSLFWMLKQLTPKIATETAIVITADHGQENITSENKIIVSPEEEEELNNLIRARGRSGRVIHLYAKENKQEEVVDWFTDKINEKGIVLTPKDYPKLMGKGANTPKIVERLGDIQVILGDKASMFFGHSGEYDSTYGLGLNATHGSLSKDELLVPLLIGRVSDFIE
ncbi:MAG: alkaline phosphatase family protein [Asgard group archaeon]|nr:alkaline phosphatase family protein [Asgard group archaeon]